MILRRVGIVELIHGDFDDVEDVLIVGHSDGPVGVAEGLVCDALELLPDVTGCHLLKEGNVAEALVVEGGLIEDDWRGGEVRG